MDDRCREISFAFTGPLTNVALLEMSVRLQHQLMLELQEENACMIPSFNHSMPTGDEFGRFLALDIGGSTLRVAIVRLYARAGPKAEPTMAIEGLRSWKIDNKIKAKQGKEFFAWMAQSLNEMLLESNHALGRDCQSPVDMGIAWSFPLRQTSLRSGTLQTMGKGFRISSGILDQDISNLIESSCAALSLHVRVQAIVNDSTATLLSRAYVDESTRLAFILGTGINAAVYLPVSALARSKLGGRPSSWCLQAENVVVNTEMSMFGKNIFPVTPWDEALNATQLMPDFQPFEQLVSGMYLGEILRLVLVDCVKSAGMFGGNFPGGMNVPYSLDTATMAVVEGDQSPELQETLETLSQAFIFEESPSLKDLQTVKQITGCISRRAAAYLAVGIHALWSVYVEATSNSALLSGSAENDSPRSDRGSLKTSDSGSVYESQSTSTKLQNRDKIAVGCNGSVFEKYPGFAFSAQSYLDELCSARATPRLVLQRADDSALYGATIAASIAHTSQR